MLARYGLRVVALAYLAMLLLVPVGMIVYHTFSSYGVGPVWNAMTQPDAIAALELTLKVALIAVPLNTVFGIVFALMMVRSNIPGKAFLNALVDLPFAVSPVVVGFT